LAFFGSLSDGFTGRVDRLVHLIGRKHWPSVGVSRETLLRDFLREYLPRRYCVSTGFILFEDPRAAKKARRDSLLSPSPQIDVLVWDHQEYGPHFVSGDFVVLPPGAVELAIMVKSTLGTVELRDDVAKLLSVSRSYDVLRKISAYEDVPTPGLLLFAWTERRLKNAVALQPQTIASRLRDLVLDHEASEGRAYSYLFPPQPGNES
jgi:hypothetical protein